MKNYLPQDYEKDSVKNYPLTVVFNAEYLFDVYVGNSVLFAAKDKAPKQIVVGISMEKTRKKDTYFNLDNGRLTASNSAFYQFVRDEVLSYMERTYRTSPFISFIGEGTSANLISYYLQESTPYINSYYSQLLTWVIVI
ncbi:alpha/beta hydrolase-fold protein [Polaribacter sp.]|nr:alpha/beta hydrolase-fold protein [Polaribacter sp.]